MIIDNTIIYIKIKDEYKLNFLDKDIKLHFI